MAAEDGMEKWVEFKPIGCIGLVMFLIGMLGPHLLNIEAALIKWLGVFVAIIGVYQALKGREEH